MKMGLLFAAFTMLVAGQAFAKDPLEGVPQIVADLHKVVTSNGCDVDLPSATESFDLGFDFKLYIVPCMMGAYQGFGQLYVTGSKDQNVTQVPLLTYNHAIKAVVPTFDVGDAGYDPATKTLTTFSKGRGIGDCGESTKSKVVVEEFTWAIKTTEIRSKAKCDGNIEKRWPVVFKQ